jgi:hypothetical protein
MYMPRLMFTDLMVKLPQKRGRDEDLKITSHKPLNMIIIFYKNYKNYGFSLCKTYLGIKSKSAKVNA